MTRNNSDNISDDETANVAALDDEAFEDLTKTMITPSSDYKVRGKDAISSGAAVQGHNTAGSGSAHGVEAFVDSGESDAAGLYAEATQKSGSTYGVHAVTQSNRSSSAALFAHAPNSAQGILVSAPGSTAIEVTQAATNGVYSSVDSSGYNAIHGHNDATDGYSWGVRGDSDSPNSRAFGVKGQAQATTGNPKGVGGVTKAEGSDAAGVYGETKNSNQGVLGEAYDSQSNLNSLASFESAGVFGRTDKSDGWAIAGWSNNNDAVFGRTDDGSSYALYGFNTGSDGAALGAFGSAYVDEYMEISEQGASYYHGSQQTIPSGSNTVLKFDTSVADPRGEFQNSSAPHEFVLDKAGTYRVESGAKWLSVSSGTTLYHEIWVDDGSGYERRAASRTERGVSSTNSTSVSKDLHGLGAGDKIRIEVYHTEGSDLTIDNGKEWTYATFTRMG